MFEPSYTHAPARSASLPDIAMSMPDVASGFLQGVVFLTTLVNFHLALFHAEPIIIAGLYIVTRVLGRSPDDFCLETCPDY